MLVFKNIIGLYIMPRDGEDIFVEIIYIYTFHVELSL